MAAYKAYTGDYIFAGADFYIHKRKRDIGKAAGGNHMGDREIANVFSRQKEQAGEASKTMYKTLFLKNLKVDDGSIDLLNALTEEDNDSIIEEIDKQIKRNLQSAINQEELSKLMDLYKDTATFSKNLLGEAQVAVDAFGKMLDNFAEASMLVHGPAGEALASLLIFYKDETTSSNKLTLRKMGQTLHQIVDDYIHMYPIVDIDEAKILDALNALNRLGTSFKTGKTSTNESVIESNITRVVDSVFSSGFSEVVSSQVRSVIGLTIDETLTKLVGHKTSAVQFSDVKGRFIDSLGGKKAAQKTDISNPAVEVVLDKSEVTPQGGNITMTLGISGKFYRTTGFPGGKYDGQKIHFSSGSGGSLKEALNTLLETDMQHYLAYNTLFQGSDGLPASTVALQDIILTRQITRLFATRGGVKDFSQYIIVNGQVVSIWDLLQYALRNDVGLSKSMDKDEKQAISLHIQGRKEIFMYSKEKNARIRVPNVNKAINRATISANVRVEKLIQAIPTADATLRE